MTPGHLPQPFPTISLPLSGSPLTPTELPALPPILRLTSFQPDHLLLTHSLAVNLLFAPNLQPCFRFSGQGSLPLPVPSTSTLEG